MTGARIILLLAACVSLTMCGGGSLAIPPCNAIIWLWGAADLRLDCPAADAIPVLTQRPPPNQ